MFFINWSIFGISESGYPTLDNLFLSGYNCRELAYGLLPKLYHPPIVFVRARYHRRA